MLGTIAMTLLDLFLFMFFIIMLIVYFDFIFSIVSLLLCLCINLYSAHSKVPWVGGQYCVSVVLMCCLPTNTPHILGHVVDHRCDTPIESFVVYSLNIGQVGSSYEGRQAMFLIFLSNIPYVLILAMTSKCNCTN